MQVTVPSTDAANKPHGMLRPGPLRSRNREWVGTVTWKPFHAAEPDYELRLGESVHIEGLGTVTLLEVNPPQPSQRSTSSERETLEDGTIE